MLNSVIFLVKETTTKSPEGFDRFHKERRKVFADVTSVSSAEFFRAGEQGLKPQLRMTIYSNEYDGEKQVEYDGIMYEIYRTYQSKVDMLELYVERQVGKNGSSS